ncbi:hypothetical protein GGTG_02022, partial [Gaeumannomyces tritici R3-111a-1]
MKEGLLKGPSAAPRSLQVAPQELIRGVGQRPLLAGKLHHALTTQTPRLAGRVPAAHSTTHPPGRLLWPGEKAEQAAGPAAARAAHSQELTLAPCAACKDRGQTKKTAIAASLCGRQGRDGDREREGGKTEFEDVLIYVYMAYDAIGRCAVEEHADHHLAARAPSCKPELCPLALWETASNPIMGPSQILPTAGTRRAAQQYPDMTGITTSWMERRGRQPDAAVNAPLHGARQLSRPPSLSAGFANWVDACSRNEHSGLVNLDRGIPKHHLQPAGHMNPSSLHSRGPGNGCSRGLFLIATLPRNWDGATLHKGPAAPTTMEGAT